MFSVAVKRNSELVSELYITQSIFIHRLCHFFLSYFCSAEQGPLSQQQRNLLAGGDVVELLLDGLGRQLLRVDDDLARVPIHAYHWQQ